MKRGFILILVIFLLSISIVNALEVQPKAVQRHVLPGEKPVFDLILTNNEGKDLPITVNSADLNWILEGDAQTLVLRKDEVQTIRVSFSPIGKSVRPGDYGIQIKVSTPVSTLEKILQIKLLSYEKVLTAGFDGSAVFDPKRGNLAKLSIKNNYEITLNDLSISVSSDHFEHSQTFSIEREESKVLEFDANIPQDAIEGEYNSRVLIKSGENILVDQDVRYQIAKHSNVKELVVDKGGIFSSSSEVTISNEGNSPSANTYLTQLSSIEYRLASFNPEPHSINQNDEGYEIVWQYSLMPGESYVIDYKVSYVSPIIVLLVLIALGFLWYFFRKKNPLVIEKRILSMHGEIGSNVHIIKVVLNIRNRGAVSVNNVRIMDRVPRTIKAPASFGSLKPTTVNSSTEGAIIIWDIPTIKAGSESVISYRLEGKMQVLDSIILPQAKGKYKLFGRQVLAISNSASLRSKK